MGPIVDHAFEHLAPSDIMITRTRRRLLTCGARALREEGALPPGVGGRRGLPRRPRRLPRQRQHGCLAGAAPASWRRRCIRQAGARGQTLRVDPDSLSNM